jgi:hypothetical protein
VSFVCYVSCVFKFVTRNLAMTSIFFNSPCVIGYLLNLVNLSKPPPQLKRFCLDSPTTRDGPTGGGFATRMEEWTLLGFAVLRLVRSTQYVSGTVSILYKLKLFVDFADRSGFFV